MDIPVMVAMICLVAFMIYVGVGLIATSRGSRSRVLAGIVCICGATLIGDGVTNQCPNIPVYASCKSQK